MPLKIEVPTDNVNGQTKKWLLKISRREAARLNRNLKKAGVKKKATVIITG